jgi:hypothetical protein
LPLARRRSLSPSAAAVKAIKDELEPQPPQKRGRFKLVPLVAAGPDVFFRGAAP